jgi:hypothetical protein
LLPAVLDFAESMVQNAGRWWEQLEIEHRQELQQLLFPDGVPFSEDCIGTAGTPLFTELLELCRPGSERLVDLTGVEPIEASGRRCRSD